MEKIQPAKKDSLLSSAHRLLLSFIQAPTKKLLIILTAISLFLALSYELNQKPHGLAHEGPYEYSSPTHVDTFIPKGFVLFPVEILNFYSLDSIIGNYAVIDLYPKNQSSPIARGIRMIRSPADPSQVAILVPDDRSGVIAQHGAQFYAVIQSPDNFQSEFPKPKTQGGRRIIVEGGAH